MSTQPPNPMSLEDRATGILMERHALGEEEARDSARHVLELRAGHTWETVTEDGLTERLELPGLGWLYRTLGWDAVAADLSGAEALTFVPDPKGRAR